MPVKTIQLPIQGMDDHDSVAIDDAYCPNLRNVRSDRSRIVRAPGGTLLAPAPVPGTNPGFGMVTGFFNSPTSTGNQTITHNLGATPKALILFTSGVTSLQDVQTDIRYAMGFTDGTTSRTAGFAAASGTPSNTARRYANDLLSIVVPNAGIAAACSWVSWNSTQFVVNWSTVESTSRKIGYAVIGHASLTAKVIEWTYGTSGGNQAVTGVGFVPDVVMHLHANRTAVGNPAEAMFGFGAMDASGGEWAHAVVSTDNVTPHVSKGARQTNRAIHMIDLGGTSTLYSASFVSMDADGFTVNRRDSPPAGVLIASLCLDGYTNSKVGSYVPASLDTPPATYNVTGVGFAPTAILSGRVPATNGNIENDLDIFFGAADGTNDSAIAVTDDDGGDLSITAATRQGFMLDITVTTLLINGLTNLVRFDADGYTVKSTYGGPAHDYIATAVPGTLGTVGVIRNYADLIVGPTTPTEAIVMLTSKSAFTYTPVTTTSGIFSPTAEVYTGTDIQRFSIANGTDSTYGAVAVWSQGKDNLRRYNGTFGALISSGTNHAARVVLAFNNRIISVRPFFSSIDHQTQIRWSVNGDYANWNGTGSGTLEVIESSNQPLTGGFVMGGRCYLTRAREVIELIATGSLTPVFIPEPRVSGAGCIATHSIATGDVYAFWLGPDEVYQWDGAQLKAVGGRMYNTITQLVDYSAVNLDQIQAAVYEPDSQYWLCIPPYAFVYDYRRDIWDWDDTRAFAAIGRLNVQTLITGDIDHSEFIVMGDTAVQSIRVDPSSTDYLDLAIDSYFETKDFLPVDNTAMGRVRARGAADLTVSYDRLNSIYRVWFRGIVGQVVEVGISSDLGVTYQQLTSVTINAEGVGIAFFELAYSTIRLRFRNFSTDPYLIRGPLQYEYQVSGIMLPGY